MLEWRGFAHCIDFPAASSISWRNVRVCECSGIVIAAAFGCWAQSYYGLCCCWLRWVVGMSRDWNAAYEMGDTPWDKGLPRRRCELARTEIRGSVLVPGSGLGRDVCLLAAQGAEA